MRRTVLTQFILAALVAIGPAAAQSTTLTAADPRPVNAIIDQIEKLSGLPISYEDLRYSDPADTEDITASAVNPAHQIPAGFQIIVPRGGQISVGISVDPTTQKLPDSLSTANALNALLAAAGGSSIVPGRFAVEAYGNAFIVTPTQSRSADGTLAPLTSALSAPVSLSGQQQSAIKTLEAIVKQVSSAAGVRVGLGTIPMRAFAINNVTLAASNEPASHVLVRLFSAVCSSGLGAVGTPVAMSYHAFFDPKLLTYVLNIHVVRSASSPAAPVQPTAPPTPGRSPWVKKGSQ